MLFFHQSSNFFEASVIIDGLALPNVVLRKKGFIDSQSTFQLSLKIKLNHSDEKAGIEGLIQSGVHFLRLGCSEVPPPPQPDVSLIEASALSKIDQVKQHQPLRLLAGE